MSSGERMERLATRVRRTDRLRRPVAIALALVLVLLANAHLQDSFEASWPLTAALLPMIMLGAVVWWAIEAMFALQMAMWETEYDRLSRDLGLPPARVVIRRRRRK